MKNLCTFFCIILFSISILSAQENQQRYEKTAEDVLRWHELSERLRTSTPPATPVVSIAEFEPMQGVLIAYPSGGFGIPYSLISQLADMVHVTVAVSSSYLQNTVRNRLQQNGVNTDNVDFVIGAVDSYWTRDFGPWFILDGNNEFGVADFTYNRPSRPNDDEHMSIMANYLNVNHFDFPIVHTGGNYMSDGYGTAASTDLVFEENTDLSEAQIRQYCLDYLGIDNYHFTIDPQGDYIAHIDCWGKFLAVDKILIAQLPVGAARYQEYEDVANYFANATTPWGDKYKVYRVFEPGSVVSNARTPYTNSLILNDHVFVPITGTSYDEDALDVYRAAMPGYTIVGVMEQSSTPWYNTDALHCRTHEIPDFGMLRITHFPTLGAQPFSPSFNFTANINNLSGLPIVTDSARIYYRIITENDTTLWNSTAMSNIGGTQWQGEISGITDSCEVQYYLFAKDGSDRRQFYPYMAQADPFIFTVAPNTDTTAVDPGNDSITPGDDSTGIAQFLAQNITISPNPATTQITISAPHAQQLLIYNAYGQAILQKNADNTGTQVIDCSSWASGTYIIVLRDDKGNTVRKKIIKN
ncbi:MAG: agmatine deiminase family protein [Bacteroidales bacterium]|nr:agmatine deiminase family protein [Bacteroidales bacterium]